MAKRKHEEDVNGTVEHAVKKLKDTKGPEELHSKFRTGLFDELEKNRSLYAGSEPYKHGVIRSLIDDDLLRRVRKEIVNGIHFTEKETDIYKIHQSGDLANLDGLDDDSLKQLPSLLELRNAMYSAPFREYISSISDAGPLSGRKTDMAINVYTPGSHLLCHDDVIGSRRVSYILYLTDPDNPWQSEWGGALRLYPTRHIKQVKGPKLRTPDPDFSVSIPPAWNQMSFFAVQPGESFHDVEEVYHSGDLDQDKLRVRMAISGWYHIPQSGEDGFVEGAEEALAKSSSLTQLQTKDAFDVPRTEPVLYPEYKKLPSKADSKKPEDPDQDTLTTTEIDYLLQFMAPKLLTPDGVESLHLAFAEASCIRLDDFLSKKFSESVKEEIQNGPKSYDAPSADIESSSSWTVARPPHKHRYLFMLPEEATEAKPDLLSKEDISTSPLKRLLSVYLPSPEFRKWLHLATGLVCRSHDLKARRFRRGADYQLATSYDEENPRLEMTLGLTPDGQWESEEISEGTEKNDNDAVVEEINNGGYEVWMAPDDDDDDDEDDTKDEEDGEDQEDSKGKHNPTAGSLTNGTSKSKTSDPAIYKPTLAADDGILFSMAAGWNRLSLVLRDSGTHRFVKYVSRNAGADRWDVTGEWDVDWDATPDSDDEGDEEEVDEEDVDGNEDEDLPHQSQPTNGSGEGDEWSGIRDSSPDITGSRPGRRHSSDDDDDDSDS